MKSNTSKILHQLIVLSFFISTPLTFAKIVKFNSKNLKSFKFVSDCGTYYHPPKPNLYYPEMLLYIERSDGEVFLESKKVDSRLYVTCARATSLAIEKALPLFKDLPFELELAKSGETTKEKDAKGVWTCFKTHIWTLTNGDGLIHAIRAQKIPTPCSKN